MGICSGQMMRDVQKEDMGSVAVGSRLLLSELIQIDLKGKAESRQIRNIDLKKRVV